MTLCACVHACVRPCMCNGDIFVNTVSVIA